MKNILPVSKRFQERKNLRDSKISNTISD